MATEIERKFLLQSDAWRAKASGALIRQGYLSSARQAVVRIRVIEGKAWLTVKGETRNLTRAEFEYEIPVSDANQMLDELCEQPLIEKTRHHLTHADHDWVIDEFHGVNDGLIVAEIELSSEDEFFEQPDWLGEEVSDDPRYFNSNLIKHPYSKWQD